MNSFKNRRGFMALAVVALTTSVAACGTPSDPPASASQIGSHASRVELYPSIKSMVKDSAVVVVGTVTDRRVSADITPDLDFTISSLTVDSVEKSNGTIDSGHSIEVRQVGSEDQLGPAPLMTVGSTYLLYLTPSGLEGELATQFYVTGGNAGLYAAAAGSREGQARSANAMAFEQVQREPSETLPSELTLDEATG